MNPIYVPVALVLCAGPLTKLHETVVFRSGQEGHYAYRIPSLVYAGQQRLVAFAEGRRDRLADPGGGHINLVYKISRDGGKSWSELRVLEEPDEGGAVSNPTAVYDHRRGRIWLFYNRWAPGRGEANSRPGHRDNTLWARFSDDGGSTWSAPIDLTDAGRDVQRWKSTVFGPGSALITSKGLIVVPAYGHEPGRKPISRAAFLMWSRDGMKWQRGPWVKVPCNESQVVELPNGNLLVDSRQERGPHRWTVETSDNGKTWQEPRPGLQVTPVCTGLARLPTTPPVYVWSGPQGPGRRDLVLRISRDACRSFEPPVLIGPGPAAYSDLEALPDGTLAVLWEAGQRTPYETIRFARVAVEAQN